MKFFLNLVFMGSLFFIQGCNDTTEIQGDQVTIRTFDPLSCQEAGEGCDMNWFLYKDAYQFPSNIQISVNDKKIYDECLREGNAGITRGLDKVTIVLWNYINLKGDEKFKLQITDLKDCYSGQTIFYLNSNQSFEIKTSSDIKRVEINL